ncbi:MAG: UvrD-helicase domain-containing protein, partial [Methylococcales bacterium]|nr:UvrD-helicase domain-containing protein [Methylococcales bacterium]
DLEQIFIELKQLVETHKDTIDSSLQIIEDKLSEGKFKPGFENNFKSTYQGLMDWLNQTSFITPDFSVFTYQGLADTLNGHKFRKSKANPLSSVEQKQAYIESLNFDFEPFEQLDLVIKRISLVFRRSLLQTLRDDVDKRLQQLNVLSFDDLITRLADALSDKKGQALRQEIQQRYQAALIDEFQDTDHNQWLIFSTLFNHTQNFLYLIGDPKQAIYKFRGADIYSYFAAQQQAQHHFTLSKNWRSHPGLVAGINTLFTGENAFYSDQLKFNPVDSALSSEQGVLTQDNQEQAPLVLWQLDKGEDDHWSSGKAANEIKQAVVNEILNLLTDNFYIQKATGENNIQAKDIAILVRSNPQAKGFQLALNDVGITAVINSKESVFCTQEANHLYILLQAISHPANNTLLKQALTLDWFKLNGQQLFQTLNDEEAMDLWVSHFLDYQQLWLNKGLMTMTKSLLAVEKVHPHLSSHKQAERRITNLQHCIELVQQAAIDEHLGINKTLDWLHQNITQAASSKTSSDEQQLRLESDEDAVKIITMHSAKGLEYAIVFCPFLWQRGNRLLQENSKISCHINNEMIVDLGSEQFEQHRLLALDEELAEDLRVFYVAVTRAKYRCYINWADVRTKDKANNSAMAYLLDFSAYDFSQQQTTLQSYSSKQPSVFEYRLLKTEQEITRTWQAKSSISKLSCKQRQRSLYTHWQMSSYTALSSLSIHEVPELPDDKAREGIILQATERDKTELPRGAHTGNVIHDLLENIPFILLAENHDISQQRDKSCLRYGLKTNTPELIDQLLQNTVNTVLANKHESFSLKDLDQQQCLKEMPFYLSMNTMDASLINSILIDCPTYQPLSEKTMCGYLTGFIDLICEHQGKYYVMDYKSNSLENYDQESLVQAMREHNYGLQYWIYTLVLHLYLQHRLPEYNYEDHFGGVKYLFIRGMNEKIENSGVYQTKPELFKIEQLANLFIPE